MGLVQSAAPASEPITLAEAKTHLRVTSTDDDTHITSLITAARQWAENATQAVFFEQTWKLTLDSFSDKFYGHPSYPSRIVIPKPPLLRVDTVKYYDTSNIQQTLPVGIAGTLTTRTDGDTGVITSSSHGYTDAGTISVFWSGGCRYGMTVSNYDADTVTLDGGSGNDFPVEGATVTIYQGAGLEPDYMVVTSERPGYIEPAWSYFWPNTYSRREAVEITFTCGVASVADIPEQYKSAIKILVAHLYENRELTSQYEQKELPYSAWALLRSMAVERAL